MTAAPLNTEMPNLDSPIISKQGFDINAYIDWFEKISLNTMVWQLIVLFVLLSFRKELKQALTAIVSRIPQIKSIAGLEFLSEETTGKISENEEKLTKEVKPYMLDVSQDPNMVFLSNYINSERDLIDLYTKVFKLSGTAPLLDRTDKLIKELIGKEALNPSALSVYFDIRQTRNKIVHGQKVFSSFEEAENYLKAVILLKDMIKDGLEKVK